MSSNSAFTSLRLKVDTTVGSVISSTGLDFFILFVVLLALPIGLGNAFLAGLISSLSDRMIGFKSSLDAFPTDPAICFPFKLFGVDDGSVILGARGSLDLVIDFAAGSLA